MPELEVCVDCSFRADPDTEDAELISETGRCALCQEDLLEEED